MPQSFSNVLVHLIFSTKNREPLITTDIEILLHQYLAATFKDHESPTLTIGGMPDHVHILFTLSRKITIAAMVEHAKTSSSKWIKSKDVRGFYWQSGYGAFSIGQSNVEALKTYIANQKMHHRKKTFQGEYREFLRKYDVDYDERYVWD